MVRSLLLQCNSNPSALQQQVPENKGKCLVSGQFAPLATAKGTASAGFTDHRPQSPCVGVIYGELLEAGTKWPANQVIVWSEAHLCGLLAAYQTY